MANIPEFISRYWGKAQPHKDAPHHWHPAAYHSLDVTACAVALLARSRYLRRHVKRLLGANGVALVILLAALHDLGKWSAGFQCVVPDRRAELWPEADPDEDWEYGGKTREYYHDALGHALWQTVVSDQVLPGLSRSERGAWRLLLSASCGHHGGPPNSETARTSLYRACSEADFDHAAAYAREVFDLLAPADLTVPTDPETLASASFLVAAIINVADWLGSQQAGFFEYHAPDLTLAEYWQQVALPAAERVLDWSGLCRDLPVPPTTMDALFPEITDPSPLQRLAQSIGLPSGPQLWLIEDSTGSGKTEAADVLAARLVARGDCRSIAFALPSITTTDEMARRHAELMAALTGGNGLLGLAHSDAKRSRSRLFGDSDTESWLLSNNRLAVSSDLLTTTIDQLILAALPSRFAVVRLLGLLDKAVIIDEAHAYDAYTGELLAGLLRLLGRFQRPVIVLSATLPIAVKQRLVRAYAEGAGLSPDLGDVPELADEHYPLVTLAHAGGVETHHIDPAPHAIRHSRVRLTDDIGEIVDRLLDTARSGKCAVWVRNTVDDAIEGYELLASQHDDVTLLHTRMPSCELNRRKADVLHRFGKKSTQEQRAGGIVVSTQLIEESLNLDFDWAASDLAPIDAVIQRFGRWGRHARDEHGNPLPYGEADRRAPSTALVLSRDPTGEVGADWYSGLLPRAAYVYQHHGVIWRTASVLRQHGVITYPGNVRALIEAVYSGAELPEALRQRTKKSEKKQGQEQSQGSRSLVDLDAGYRFDGALYGSDVRIPTRLGDSVEFILVRRDDAGKIVPWEGQDWQSGQVRLRYDWAYTAVWSGSEEELAMLKKIAPLKFRELVMVENESATLINGRGEFHVHIDAQLGIVKCI